MCSCIFLVTPGCRIPTTGILKLVCIVVYTLLALEKVEHAHKGAIIPVYLQQVSFYIDIRSVVVYEQKIKIKISGCYTYKAV